MLFLSLSTLPCVPACFPPTQPDSNLCSISFTYFTKKNKFKNEAIIYREKRGIYLIN